jgi:HK97 family phage major capsid protein
MEPLTREQLADHIKGVVLPLIETQVGNAVKSVVEGQMAKSLEANSKAFVTPFMAALGDHKLEKELKAEDKGLKFGRFVRAAMLSKIEGGGRKGVAEVLKSWGDDQMVADYEASRAKALAASDATAGGFLVPPQYSQEVIEFLRAKSVVRQLGPIVIPMSTGTFRIPKVTVGASASYIGENAKVPKTQQTFGNVTLTFKKLAALVPVSNDLLRYSSPGADAIVRDDLVRSMADAENRAFLRSDGTSGSPRGFLNWCLPGGLLNANATSNLANVTTDLGNMIVNLMNNNIPMTKPVWIWSPRTWNFLMTVQTANGVFAYRDEMMRGTFWGYPYGVTTAIPSNLNTLSRGSETEIYLIDMADAALGESMNLAVDASQEAAYTDGGTLVSAYEQDQTVIRAISEHDLVMRRQESVCVLQGAVYGK